MIVGIDPGLDGAIACLNPNGGAVTVEDMPCHLLTTNGKARRQLDLHALARMFDGLALAGAKLCVIEEPNSMPTDGVVQAFKFGFNCGVPQAMAVAFSIPVHLVKPARWKAAFGLTSGKDMSRKRASEIMPKFSSLWALKKHDGRAEAALLALYGVRHAH